MSNKNNNCHLLRSNNVSDPLLRSLLHIVSSSVNRLEIIIPIFQSRKEIQKEEATHKTVNLLRVKPTSDASG